VPLRLLTAVPITPGTGYAIAGLACVPLAVVKSSSPPLITLAVVKQQAMWLVLTRIFAGMTRTASEFAPQMATYPAYQVPVDLAVQLITSNLVANALEPQLIRPLASLLIVLGLVLMVANVLTRLLWVVPLTINPVLFCLRPPGQMVLLIAKLHLPVVTLALFNARPPTPPIIVLASKAPEGITRKL